LLQLKCPGLNLQAADHNGATALHLSAKVGYLEGVQLLLEAGARMSIADYDGKRI
jgi:ankyrin repeat protein